MTSMSAKEGASRDSRSVCSRIFFIRSRYASTEQRAQLIWSRSARRPSKPALCHLENLQRSASAPSSHRSIDILRSTLSPSIELSRGSQPSYLRAKPSSTICGTSAMSIIAARPWATNGLEADPSIAMLTRGSPKTLATFRFRWPDAIQIKFSSKMNHAGVVCGEPSDRRVVNHAISRFSKDRVAASDSRVVTR